MMPRLKRRLQIPRQRQTRCFDPEQYYLEEADYARAVRKVRVLLRQNQPVLLMAEEWPLDLQCLVDLSASLQWSRPQKASWTWKELDLIFLDSTAISQAPSSATTRAAPPSWGGTSRSRWGA